MLYHPVHYCITIHILELHVWTVIIWLVMYRITCIEYEQLDAVFAKYVQFHIIKMAAISII